VFLFLLAYFLRRLSSKGDFIYYSLLTELECGKFIEEVKKIKILENTKFANIKQTKSSIETFIVWTNWIGSHF